jgi:hypothetical protein
MAEEALLKALNDIIDAWEALAGDTFYQPRKIEEWLTEKIGPEINKARLLLGRKKPNK